MRFKIKDAIVQAIIESMEKTDIAEIADVKKIADNID